MANGKGYLAWNLQKDSVNRLVNSTSNYHLSLSLSLSDCRGGSMWLLRDQRDMDHASLTVPLLNNWSNWPTRLWHFDKDNGANWDWRIMKTVPTPWLVVNKKRWVMSRRWILPPCKQAFKWGIPMRTIVSHPWPSAVSIFGFPHMSNRLKSVPCSIRGVENAAKTAWTKWNGLSCTDKEIPCKDMPPHRPIPNKIHGMRHFPGHSPTWGWRLIHKVCGVDE